MDNNHGDPLFTDIEEEDKDEEALAQEEQEEEEDRVENGHSQRSKRQQTQSRSVSEFHPPCASRRHIVIQPVLQPVHNHSNMAKRNRDKESPDQPSPKRPATLEERLDGWCVDACKKANKDKVTIGIVKKVARDILAKLDNYVRKHELVVQEKALLVEQNKKKVEELNEQVTDLTQQIEHGENGLKNKTTSKAVSHAAKTKGFRTIKFLNEKNWKRPPLLQ